MRRQNIPLLLLVALVSLVMVAPLLWMLLGSVRTDAEIVAAPFGWPREWRWGQWAEAWRAGNLARFGANSLVVTVLSAVGTVFFGAAAAYGLARQPVAGSKPGLPTTGWKPVPLLLLYLVGLVVPAQAAVVPLFLLLRTLRLLGTWWALVLPYIAWNLPVSVFIFYGFFQAQSTEPEEAARLDGCDAWRLFWRVALPQAAPATGVVAALTALGTWNEFLFALLFISSDSVKTLPLGLLAFSSAHSTDHGLTFAALAMISLPILLAYVFIQRTLIEGSAGALG